MGFRTSARFVSAAHHFLFLTNVLVLPWVIFSQLVFADNTGGQIPTVESAFVEDYRIGANDVLEIAVYGEEGLTQEVRVTTSGFVTYPLLGRIKVSGMSVVELEDFIRRALAKDYIRDPQVKVFVKEFSNVYVFGQVKEPGPYLFKGGMTVLQAITTAGGFTKIANARKVRVVRTHGDERKIIHMNVSEITKGDEEDIVLQPGDTVVVPESFF
ncbi:MAG: polysaccharide export protein [Candidatus Omnitrophica bacterium]|nr:polysaccharide export protein [Candidatus Omnitrophota bacterium]